MLTLFRNNQSTTVLLLALYVGILHVPAILGWVPPPSASRDTEGGLLFHYLFGWAAGNAFASALGATALVYFQAILINRFVDTFRMMNDRNWIPGALYALVASCLPDLLFISPVLIAATFIPILLQRLFSVYKQTQAYGAVFDTAFWLTLTSLIHPPAIWLFPAAYIAFFNLRTFPPREQAVFFTGIFSPMALVFTGHFWFDQDGALIQTQLSRCIFLPGLRLPADLYGSLKVSLLGLILVATLLGFNVYYHKRLIQTQKYITILYWFLFAGMLAALFQPAMRLEYFFLIAPTVSIFLAYLFQSTRNVFMIEVFHFTLLSAVFILQFFPR
ncbi:MAG: hypothetical protein IPM81_14770 [Saprospirales bacterium]|nr:hypothetical protein [Saprospirales bacterium]